MTISGNVGGESSYHASGYIVLNGTNSYIGSTTINGGSVTLGTPSALGAAQ